MPVGALVDVGPGTGEVPAWAVPAEPVVDRAALLRFVAACFRSAGVVAADARLTADVLVLADARGHPSHGVSRLRQYLRLVDSGSVSGRPAVRVLDRRTALERWDADHALGPAVAHRAMGWAIRRARRTGIAAVVVKEAGHFGIAGAYVLRAMDAGMCAIAVCNGTPIIPPTGARAPALGTNPLAVGVPDGEGRGFLLDMATSVVAGGKVEVAARRGLPIPPGWALDAEGRPTTDATAALAGMMLPLGGPAETSGYKGYGLAAAIDLLTGVLGGGASASSVAGMWDTGHPSTIGQLLVAVDPGAFGDPEAFFARVKAWRAEMVGRPRQAGVDEILVPGDKEWRADDAQRDRVRLVPEVVEDLARLAVERRLLRAWRRAVAE
jgi:LDH2 family malate/lactate/ureidoglycolate dehydrogenase